MVQAKAPNGVDAPGRASVGKRTLRTDLWWGQPLATWVLLTIWLGYATFRVFWRQDYFAAKYDYLSPFTSPCVSANCVPGSQTLGRWFDVNFPPFIPLAVITLTFLLGFRLTCYYYRKAYYRSFWRAPSACAVPEPHAKYTGETRFPLIFQNAHRYFWWMAVIISLVNTYDVIHSLFHGFGFGTLVMTANVLLLYGYTFGCHHCRHAIGGRLRHFSKHPVRYRLWTLVSKLTARHMQFAWTTLTSLMLTDMYIWFVSAGYFPDLFYIHF